MPKLLSCVMLVCLAATGCRSAETGQSLTDPALTAFVPADAVALAAIRMDQVRATPLYRKLESEKRLPQFSQFNPGTDLKEVLIASNGNDTLVASRGRFDVKIPESAQKSVYKGYTIYAGDQGGFTFIDKSIALAGTKPALRAAIDQYKSGTRSEAVRTLLGRARAIAGQNQIWAVSTGPGSIMTLPQRGNAANLSKIFQALEDTTFVADLRAGFHANLTGICKTEQDAKTLGDALRGLAGLGRLSVPENRPQLLRLYDGIQVDQQQRSIKVTAAIPADLIDQLLEMVSERPRLPRSRSSDSNPGSAPPRRP